MPLQRTTIEEPRESIDTGLELRWTAVASEVVSMNDNPARLRGEDTGRNNNDPGDATANSNDLH
jgi:hypothetical protein